MVERLVRNEKAGGSNPPISTIKITMDHILKNLFFYFTLAVALFFFSPATYAAKPKLTDLGRGHYEVLITKPKGTKPYPLLVIVPAKEYTMTGSLFEDLATAAAANGFYVVRFNWGFVTNADTPSKDLSTEVNDLKTVVNYFLQQKDIDPSRVYYLAKSFGTRVVMIDAFKNKKTKGLALLTPNCSAKQPFTKTYGKLAQTKIPLHIVISKEDPHCDVNQIHKALPGFSKKWTTFHSVFGDHGFKTTKNEKKDFNRQVALDGIINWLRSQNQIP